MKYDQVLVILGEFGTFQKRIFAWICLFLIFSSWDVTISVFLLYQPKHRCQLPDYPNDTYDIQSHHHFNLINQSIPRNDEGKILSCLVNTARGENSTRPFEKTNDLLETRPCERWVYDRSVMRSTLTEKLSIVCDRSILRAHQYFINGLGLLVGALVGGIITDWIGRQKAFLLFLALEVASAFGNAFISNDVLLFVCRFLINMGNGVTFISIYIIGVEIVGPSKRMWTNSLAMVFWALGQFHLDLLAFLLRDWQQLVLALSAPMIFFFSFYWLTPESPRWLLSRGRQKEAVAQIMKMAKVNKVDLDPRGLETLTLEEERSKSLRHLLRSKRLLIRYSILIFSWHVINAVYYGLVFNVANLSGDLYLNFFLSVVVEVVGYASSLLFLNRMGRRPLLAGCLLGSGVVCLATILPVLLKSGDRAEQVSLMLLSNLGKMLVSASFSCVYIYTTELFPTVCRSTRLSACAFAGKVGTMVSPYIADLGLYVGGKFGSVLPLLVFGGSSIVAGILALLLPETLGRRLPETVQDAEDFDRCLIEVGGSDEARMNVHETSTSV